MQPGTNNQERFQFSRDGLAGRDQRVRKALVIAFTVIVLNEFVHSPSEMSENVRISGLVFDAGLPPEARSRFSIREGGKDGRVVDGGGLENRAGRSVKFAISRPNRAHHVT